MVAGPSTSFNLPARKKEGIHLSLTPLPDTSDSENEDKNEFTRLHASFKPGAAIITRCQPTRNYYLTCACFCTQTLTFAVKASHDSIMKFQLLLTGPDFTLICPNCCHK